MQLEARSVGKETGGLELFAVSEHSALRRAALYSLGGAAAGGATYAAFSRQGDASPDIDRSDFEERSTRSPL